MNDPQPDDVVVDVGDLDRWGDDGGYVGDDE